MHTHIYIFMTALNDLNTIDLFCWNWLGVYESRPTDTVKSVVFLMAYTPLRAAIVVHSHASTKTSKITSMMISNDLSFGDGVNTIA